MKFSRGSLASTLIGWLPPYNGHLYRLCKRYVDRYNGENNDDIETNGELRLLRRLLPECRTVFDIGANVGHWAALALTINPRVNLYCFEPSQATYQRLVANQFPANVVCSHLGLSSAPGEARLLIFEDGAGINSLYRLAGLRRWVWAGDPTAGGDYSPGDRRSLLAVTQPWRR